MPRSALLIIASMFLFSAAAAQRLAEGELRIESKPRITPKEVKGPSVARKPRVNGVLFVLTDPPSANVIIKKRGAVVSRGRSEEGQFRAELLPGSYEIEVTAEKYAPYKVTHQLKLAATSPVRAELSPQTGSIIIGFGEEDAIVLIDGQKPAKLSVKKADNQIVIDEVPTGLHKLKIEHASIVSWEREQIEVRGGATSYLTPKFNAALAEMRLQTDPGTAVYIDSEYVGDTTNDGSLSRGNIKLGRHEIKLVKYGFEEYLETRQFEFGKPVQIKHTLVPRTTSSEFAEYFAPFNRNRWIVPDSGWRVDAGRLYVENCPSLLFPSGFNYRPFTMHFHLKLEDGRGAAWALRVKDSNNYYLFYLSGPKGRYPNSFVTYVIRDGKFDVANFADSAPVVVDLKQGGEYEIDITFVNNVVEHTIIPAATGQRVNLGAWKDTNSLFYYGGFGFRNIAGEKFSIDDLVVQPRPSTSR